MKKDYLYIVLLLICFCQVSTLVKAQTEVGTDFILSNADGKDLKYEIIDETSVALIPNGYKGEIIIPSKVEYSEKEFVVTKLWAKDNSLFESEVTKVEIPSTVIEIRGEKWDYIFDYSGITELILPENLERIDGCLINDVRGIKSLSIPHKVKELKNELIQYTQIEEISLGRGVEKIEEGTFQRMWKLARLEVCSTEVPDLAESAFEVAGPENITLRVPNGCKSKYEASERWTKFKEIIENPGSAALGDTISVENKDGVEIKYLALWDGLAVLGNSYSGEIEIPEFIEGYKVGELRGTESLPVFGEDVTSVVIPESIEILNGYVFDGANITSIHLPKTLTSYGTNNFKNMTQLESLTLPPLGTLPQFTVTDCSGLKEIIIEKVEFIDPMAFDNCENLEKLVLKNNNIVPNLRLGALDGLNLQNIVLYVPKGSKRAYDFNWGDLGFKAIVELNESGIEDVEYSSYKIVDGRMVLADNTYVGNANIYNLQGKLISILPVENGYIDLNGLSGLFIVEVGGIAYKVYLK